MIARIICRLVGHEPWPFRIDYWHSCERCMRCGRLVDSPMVAPQIWGKR